MTPEQRGRLNEVIWVEYIEGGSTIDEFFADYPSVTRDQVIQFLELGKDQLVE